MLSGQIDVLIIDTVKVGVHENDAYCDCVKVDNSEQTNQQIEIITRALSVAKNAKQHVKCWITHSTFPVR